MLNLMVRGLLIVSIAIGSTATTFGIDYFLTIGGGYSSESNQATLEANVVFFQSVLAQSNRSATNHRIHFADGFDSELDLQVAITTGGLPPATALLEEVFAPPGGQVGYRNHMVPSINGSNRIRDIRASFDHLKNQLKSGDRLLVYVTAHGGAGKSSDVWNTSISCWGNRELSMREFSNWLDSLPKSVPVLLVMAQCYCGGFSHTMFAKGDREEGLAENIRTGFFAQRHDLPAAGCRPDVENDEEYSSYFWGGLIGRSRTGKLAANVDCDGDNRISLAEAHAYAIVACESIDIPLRGSDAFLREFSRVADDESESDAQNSTASDQLPIQGMTGTLGDLANGAAADQRRIIEGLADRLSLRLDQNLGDIIDRYAQAQQDFRQVRRGSGRRGRGGFGRRRDLREAILAQWPELKDQTGWGSSALLSGPAGSVFLSEVKTLPSYEAYIVSRDEREATRKATLEKEMRQVRFQRLIHTLESIVLARNLKSLATPEVQARYLEMLALEQSYLQ